MSWQQWQPPSQPGMPLVNASMPAVGMQYTPEQWQNWQQWAQWQQQYQQWHQQYGAEYQKVMASNPMGALPLMNTPVQPPLPHEAAQPPPPPAEPLQPYIGDQLQPPNLNPTQMQENLTGYNHLMAATAKPPPSTPNVQWNQQQLANTRDPPPAVVPKVSQPQENTRPAANNFNAHKRPSSAHLETPPTELKKNKLDWHPPPGIDQPNQPNAAQTQPNVQHPQPNAATLGPNESANANQQPEERPDAEQKFIKQFAEWEAQFNKWKEQNQDHPDKAQYREYEKKWETWRNHLLERRESMRKKRLGMLATTPTTTEEIGSGPKPASMTSQRPMDKEPTQMNRTTTPSMNPINSSSLASLFKNTSNDGIPGLDLVDAPTQPDTDPVPGSSPMGHVATAEKTNDLNLEALTANITNILGDKNLMNMLSFVQQKGGLGQSQGGPQNDAISPMDTPNQGPRPHSGLAPMRDHPVPFDHDSNWSSGGGDYNGPSAWSHDYHERVEPLPDIQFERRMQRPVTPGNLLPGTAVAYEPFLGRDRDAPNKNSVPYREREYTRNRPRFIPPSEFHQEDYDAYPPEMDDNHGPYDGEMDMPPEAPTITNPDAILVIDKVISYDHKSKKDFDVCVYPPRLFDYRHKLVTRIPLPERPKWLLESLRNIPEFDPPVARAQPQYSRYPPTDRYEGYEYDYHGPTGPAGPEFGGHHEESMGYIHGRGGEMVEGYDDMYSRRPNPMSGLDIGTRERPRIDEEKRRRYYEPADWPTRHPPMVEPQTEWIRERDLERDWEGDRIRDRRPRDWDRERERDRDRSWMDRQRSWDRDRISNRSHSKEPVPPGTGNDQFPKNAATNKPSKPSDSKFCDSSEISQLYDLTDETSSKSDDPFKSVEASKSFDHPNKADSCVPSMSFQPIGELFPSASSNFKRAETTTTTTINNSTIKKTNIDDILCDPGRAIRPPRIVIILRGPPGSGKTFLAKQIKDKEIESGGSAPRILSLDDYFMVDQEQQMVEDGTTISVKDMVYEYEECMEATYRQSLLKTFKKTITDGFFSFIIVDNVNDKVKYFNDMWSYAKQNGFQVYICQLDLDVQVCTKRNIHGRSEVEIQHLVNGWEETPSHYGMLDATPLIQAGAIDDVEMEEINSPNDNFDDDENADENNEGQTFAIRSKWDNFECSIDNLAKLDGINKPLRSAGTMEDYLQLDELAESPRILKPGQKRVRWADLEERKQQEKLRAIGFVVGQTNWERMMDPTQGGSALTQTKYIDRVGVRKLNTN